MQDILRFFLLSALWILLGFKTLIFPQKITFSQAEIDRMKNTYTFYIVQNISLEVFAVKFPQLAKETQIAENDWDRVFLVSIKNIDKLLTDTLKETWSKEKEAILHKFSGTDYTSITLPEVKNYIDKVFKRSLGEMESPYLETLIICKPGYLEQPENELTDGYTGFYTTKNLKKPLGIDLKVVYPRTWLVIPGDPKTGQLQKYICNYGLGKVACYVNLENIKKENTPETVSKLLSKENLIKTVSVSDSFMSYTNEPAIDGLKTGVVKYLRKIEQIDKTIYTVYETYTTYYKYFRISVTFTYTSYSDMSEVNSLIKRYSKLTRRLILNMIILSQWERKRF